LAKKTALEKPLVIFKGGITTGGARASQSHTAALAGSTRIWRGLCRQSGIIQTSSKEELIMTLSALKHLPLPKGNRIALFGGAGGGSVTMTDVIESRGLIVPSLSETSISDLEKTMPLEGHSVKNPIDMVPALFNREMFMKIMTMLDAEDNIDAVFFYVFTPGPVTGRLMESGRKGVEAFVRQVIEGVKTIKKPFYFILERDEDGERDSLLKELRGRILDVNIPVFQTLDLAAGAAFNMLQYKRFLCSHN
jgi:acyl-CoA synthetase (NDP forming)